MKHTEEQKIINFIINRVSKKATIPKPTVKEVLGVIADLAWDWKNSEYDLYGLQLEETLQALGRERCPQDRIEDLL